MTIANNPARPADQLYIYQSMTTQPILYLVDDDEDDRMFLSNAVQEVIKNLTIIEYNSGQEFLDMAFSENSITNSALLVIDMNMPKMTGIETICVLKENPELAKMPVIVISTSSNADLQKQAYAVGAVDYLIKPSSAAGLAEIAAILKAHLGRLF